MANTQKDTYWFPHDYEPTGDPKIQAMLFDYGGWGYGIFWRIAEMLHSDTQHRLPFKKYVYLAIAKQMQANASQNKLLLQQVEITPLIIENFVRDCINDYDLFLADDNFFWSNRANKNIEKKKSISEIRSEVGSKGGKSKAIGKQELAIGKQSLAITGQDNTEEVDSKQYNTSIVKNSKISKNENGENENSGESLFYQRLKGK